MQRPNPTHSSGSLLIPVTFAFPKEVLLLFFFRATKVGLFTFSSGETVARNRISLSIIGVDVKQQRHKMMHCFRAAVTKSLSLLWDWWRFFRCVCISLLLFFFLSTLPLLIPLLKWVLLSWLLTQLHFQMVVHMDVLSLYHSKEKKKGKAVLVHNAQLLF